ncbi:BREX-3 system P-loop-containing protein BrxF [Paenibacillus glucanolyticus]|uniref:BREX-3 system P-loop-containing protein BrxF n=1 Tax=Paenibacillus glucanolyticus TaxID=59843 RepID=UPI0030C9D641
MTELQELLTSEIDAARNRRNKMLFVVVNRYTPLELQNSIQQMDIPVLNVSLLLSEQLRQLPPERRPFEVGRILKLLVMQEDKSEIFLSHIEYLFDRELKQNPVRLFENISGNKTVIIHWPGALESGILKYATPEHHEYYQSDNSYASYIIEI